MDFYLSNKNNRGAAGAGQGEEEEAGPRMGRGGWGDDVWGEYPPEPFPPGKDPGPDDGPGPRMGDDRQRQIESDGQIAKALQEALQKEVVATEAILSLGRGGLDRPMGAKTRDDFRAEAEAEKKHRAELRNTKIEAAVQPAVVVPPQPVEAALVKPPLPEPGVEKEPDDLCFERLTHFFMDSHDFTKETLNFLKKNQRMWSVGDKHEVAETLKGTLETLVTFVEVGSSSKSLFAMVDDLIELACIRFNCMCDLARYFHRDRVIEHFLGVFADSVHLGHSLRMIILKFEADKWNNSHVSTFMKNMYSPLVDLDTVLIALYVEETTHVTMDVQSFLMQSAEIRSSATLGPIAEKLKKTLKVFMPFRKTWISETKTRETKHSVVRALCERFLDFKVLRECSPSLKFRMAHFLVYLDVLQASDWLNALVFNVDAEEWEDEKINQFSAQYKETKPKPSPNDMAYFIRIRSFALTTGGITADMCLFLAEFRQLGKSPGYDEEWLYLQEYVGKLDGFNWVLNQRNQLAEQNKSLMQMLCIRSAYFPLLEGNGFPPEYQAQYKNINNRLLICADRLASLVFDIGADQWEGEFINKFLLWWNGAVLNKTTVIEEETESDSEDQGSEDMDSEAVDPVAPPVAAERVAPPVAAERVAPTAAEDDSVVKLLDQIMDLRELMETTGVFQSNWKDISGDQIIKNTLANIWDYLHFLCFKKNSMQLFIGIVDFFEKVDSIRINAKCYSTTSNPDGSGVKMNASTLKNRNDMSKNPDMFKAFSWLVKQCKEKLRMHDALMNEVASGGSLPSPYKFCMDLFRIFDFRFFNASISFVHNNQDLALIFDIMFTFDDNMFRVYGISSNEIEIVMHPRHMKNIQYNDTRFSFSLHTLVEAHRQTPLGKLLAKMEKKQTVVEAKQGVRKEKYQDVARRLGIVPHVLTLEAVESVVESEFTKLHDFVIRGFVIVMYSEITSEIRLEQAVRAREEATRREEEERFAMETRASMNDIAEEIALEFASEVAREEQAFESLVFQDYYSFIRQEIKKSVRVFLKEAKEEARKARQESMDRVTLYIADDMLAEVSSELLMDAARAGVDEEVAWNIILEEAIREYGAQVGERYLHTERKVEQLGSEVAAQEAELQRLRIAYEDARRVRREKKNEIELLRKEFEDWLQEAPDQGDGDGDADVD